MARKPAKKAPAVVAPPETPADPTTQLARDILSGKLVSGLLVKAAAERHIRDIRDAPARGLFWRPGEAEHPLGFFPAILTVTAGAKAGEPFTPLWWHAFTIGCVYGWRRADGLRRFRTCYMETGKGQAKSPLMAGIGIYEMGFRGTPRAEVYAIAGDKDQANVLFRDGVAMCRADIPGSEDFGDTLESRGAVVIRGTGDMAWKIEHPESGSKFQALASGDSVSGPRPTLVLADEIHEFKTDTAIELWAQALVKMPGDPLMMLGTNTPAAGQIVGTDYSEYYQRVAKGEFKDDTSFAFIARTDEGDEPFDNEACWPKSLPALGITFPVENVRGEIAKARGLASKRLAVLRLYFGVPVGASAHWIDEGAWMDCQGRVTREGLIIDEAGNVIADAKPWPCFLGLDLSQRNDLTALAIVWRRPADGHLFSRVEYWKPAGSLDAATATDKAPYDQWAADGALNAVPGLTIGKDFVAARIQEITGVFNVEAMAFDPAHILDFIRECELIGFPVWEWKGPDEYPGDGLKLYRHLQGARGMHAAHMLWMPRSVQAVEDAILNGALTVDKSPLTTWCSANATLVADGSGNRYFDKKRSRGRIDGIVAKAMAIGAATEPTETAAAASIWDRPDMADLWK